MRIAVLQGSSQGFFPRFYNALRESILQSQGEVRLFSPNSGVNRRCVLPDQTFFGTRWNWHLHCLFLKLTGRQDCYSHFSTCDLIVKLKRYHPDVLHLHVINQCQLNLPMLVRYVNKYHIPVVWTFHDCRAFTGLCPYFDAVNCNRWKSGCGACPQLKQYSPSKKDKTNWQWEYRRKWITKIERLQIVTPSQWLAGLVGQSFLKDVPCKVIYNGVDTTGFSKASSFDVRSVYNIGNRQIVLGCAVSWNIRKGMSYFEKVAECLRQDCQIVLVGGIGETDKQRLKKRGVIVTGRTKTFEELAAWYQQASVFVNPTIEDNFPTTNIEALASGTPVVTFNTGGSPEAIDECSGLVVEKGNVEALVVAIKQVLNTEKREYKKCSQERARQFSNAQYSQYVAVYENFQ